MANKSLPASGGEYIIGENGEPVSKDQPKPSKPKDAPKKEVKKDERNS